MSMGEERTTPMGADKVKASWDTEEYRHDHVMVETFLGILYGTRHLPTSVSETPKRVGMTTCLWQSSIHSDIAFDP